MIIDREQLLTPLAGQLFNAADTASEYGSGKYDLKATTYGGNPAIGEPLEALAMLVGSDVNNVTSLVFDIVADDDGAGTNEVSLLANAKTVLLANLTEAKGVFRIGRLDPGADLAATNRYITAKVTTNGTPATTGLIRIWLSKATDAVPANAANTI